MSAYFGGGSLQRKLSILSACLCSIALQRNSASHHHASTSLQHCIVALVSTFSACQHISAVLHRSESEHLISMPACLCAALQQDVSIPLARQQVHMLHRSGVQQQPQHANATHAAPPLNSPSHLLHLQHPLFVLTPATAGLGARWNTKSLP